MSSKVTGYSRTQIALHWIIAALVVFQFVGHDAIVAFTEAMQKGTEGELPLMARAHVMLGILTFVLSIWRLFLRNTRGVPAAPEAGSAAQHVIAKLVHWLLYAAIILMPISGAAAWFGGVEQAGIFHTTFKFVVIAAVALHILGALFQQYVLKTGVIKRMMKAQG